MNISEMECIIVTVRETTFTPLVLYFTVAIGSSWLKTPADTIGLLDKPAEILTDWLTAGPQTHTVAVESVCGVIISFGNATQEEELCH